MGSRRRGREMALQVLCLLDRQPDLSVDQGMSLYFKHLSGSELDEPAPHAAKAAEPDIQVELRRFVDGIVRGVRSSLGEIDALLGRCSRNWRLERMSWVDRNLLRMASFELSSHRDIPARVVLNEAIEIARRYSTAESSGFVNGVLDRVVQELGRREAASGPALPPRGSGDGHAADPR